MTSHTFRNFVVICAILLALLSVTNAKFLARTIPTDVAELKTHFDGIYECQSSCTKNDKLDFKFLITDGIVSNYFQPTKIEIEFFSDQDVPLGKFHVNVDKDATASHALPFGSTTYSKGAVIRFGGSVTYKTISADISKVNSPKFFMNYHEGQSLTSAVSASLYFVVAPRPGPIDMTVDLIYDDDVTKAYVVLAVVEGLNIETNHMFIRPFGALRQKKDFPQEERFCKINSLDFKITVLKDEMGDEYYELTLADTYRSTYHFPRHIDISFQCSFGLQLLNDKAPYGLAFSFVPRADKGKDPNFAPIHWVTQKESALIHWHDDFRQNFKVLLPYEQYQSSYVKHTIEDPKKKVKSLPMMMQSAAATRMLQNLSTRSPPTLTEHNVLTDDGAKVVWRSHYTYFYMVYGSSLRFDPKEEHFEFKVQNTHGAKPVATQWALSVEQWAEADGKTHQSHLILDRGDAKPKSVEAATIEYELIKPVVSKETAAQHSFPFSLVSIDVELEFEKKPELIHFAPASISLTLHKKVKKHPDQPLSTFEMAVVGSYPYSQSWVDDDNNFKVIPTPLKDVNKHRMYEFRVELTPNKDLNDEFQLNLPTQHYIFSGNFNTCKVNGEVVPGLTEYGEPYDKGTSFVLAFKIKDKTTMKLNQTNTIECPDGRLQSSAPTSKLDFTNNNIPMVILGKRLADEGASEIVATLYAHTNISFTDHLSNSHAIRTFFVVLLFIVIIGLIIYFVVTNRKKITDMLGTSTPSSSSSSSYSSSSSQGNDYGDQLPSSNVNSDYQAPSL